MSENDTQTIEQPVEPEEVAGAGGEIISGDGAPAIAPVDEDASLTDLRARAAELNIEGRSSMTREQLIAEIGERVGSGGNPSDPDDPDDGRPPLREIAESGGNVTYERNLDGDVGQEG